MSETSTDAQELIPADGTPAAPPTDSPGPADGDGAAADGGPGRSSNREAAKYRSRLRETEAQRDALAERLEAMQRNEVQRRAAARLVDPEDLWRDGATLAGLLDGTGSIDPGKLEAAVAEVVARHPHWARPGRPKPDVKNLRSGTDIGLGPRRDSWSDLISGRE